jgi:hypothetical protein
LGFDARSSSIRRSGKNSIRPNEYRFLQTGAARANAAYSARSSRDCYKPLKNLILAALPAN